jgi:AraC family transcriptional regulator
MHRSLTKGEQSMETDTNRYTPRAVVSPGFSYPAARPLDKLTRLADPAPAAARGGLAPWQARKVDRYLKTNLHHRMRVEDLARQVSLSASHFAGAFKASFGTTPHLHIIRMRVQLAQILMLTTPDPLSQVALACGLADQTHLSKLFRREVGETTGAWRRRNQSDAPAEANNVHPRTAG